MFRVQLTTNEWTLLKGLPNLNRSPGRWFPAYFGISGFPAFIVSRTTEKDELPLKSLKLLNMYILNIQKTMRYMRNVLTVVNEIAHTSSSHLRSASIQSTDILSLHNFFSFTRQIKEIKICCYFKYIVTLTFMNRSNRNCGLCVQLQLHMQEQAVANQEHCLWPYEKVLYFSDSQTRICKR